MSIELLVAALVRQTTVLIAQVATTGGVRAPLAQVANQVFLDLVRELERQGISRKVSADMFGMGLRSYLRRIQRLAESSTERGRSLWEAVLEYLRENQGVTRARVLARFHGDEEALVRGVLHDLAESELIVATGTGNEVSYRAASEAELGALRSVRHGEGLAELVWALVYRMGPISKADLLALGGVSVAELDAALARLVDDGRVMLETNGALGLYSASSFVVSLGDSAGFEAAVFDHFQAAVKTISRRLRGETTGLPVVGVDPRDATGGSTYTFDLWPGHPLTAEVLGTLSQYRSNMSALRARVEAYNADAGVPARFEQVTSYAGQCAIPQERDEKDLE
jgi:hypothetical protein